MACARPFALPAAAPTSTDENYDVTEERWGDYFEILADLNARDSKQHYSPTELVIRGTKVVVSRLPSHIFYTDGGSCSIDAFNMCIGNEFLVCV